MKLELKLSSDPLEMNLAHLFVTSPECGANVIFDGVVRNSKKGVQVTHLDFEAYEPMALAELEKIAHEIADQWPIQAVFVHHRTGIVYPGQSAVIAAVSSPHRKDAFEACAFLLDRLKQTVPIWKKEYTADGAEWVTPTP
ncbi:MAG: molybdenum cofactor biosynthesis protein MoaE [Flavobacteriales bacterium]|jgi:molybdopterin synthase catalytic subunit